MKLPNAKRLAPAIVALAVAVGGLGLTGGTAFASSKPKAGASCTKSEVNKTEKVGKTTLVCKKSGNSYKWEKKG